MQMVILNKYDLVTCKVDSSYDSFYFFFIAQNIISLLLFL